MSSSQNRRKKVLPNNITISTAFLAPIDKEVKAMFTGVFHDYIKRFGVKPTKNKMHVAICGTEELAEPGDYLGSTITTEDRILIQINDPTLSRDSDHPFVVVKFVELLGHEMTHAMQTITSHDPRHAGPYRHDKKCDTESYFFDPLEVEARIMESFYAFTYGAVLMDSKLHRE